MRWCWVNFQCRGVLLIWITVGQGPTALVVGAGGGCLDIFSLIYQFSFLSLSLWETARYRLKYCLKGPLSPKTINQFLSKPLLSILTHKYNQKLSKCTNRLMVYDLKENYTHTCDGPNFQIRRFIKFDQEF